MNEKMSDELTEEELKAMLDKAKEIADKKREEQSSKVSNLDVDDTSDLENILKKKASEKED